MFAIDVKQDISANICTLSTPVPGMQWMPNATNVLLCIFQPF